MADDLRYRIGIDGSAASRTLGSLQNGIGGLHGALVSLGAIGIFTKVIKDGFEFNQTMHDGELAVAAIIQQFGNLDEAAAKQVAAGAMQKIIDLEPKVAGSLSDLVQGFSSTAAAAAGVGISVDQNIDLVGKFANALGKLALPIDQVGQELRSILSGNIGADSQLAKTLGITNEMVSAAKDAGQLYELLNSKIGKLGDAGDNAATRFSSLSSAIDKASGALAAGLFDQAIDGSAQLTAALNQNIDSFKQLGEWAAWGANTAVEGLNYIADAYKSVGVQASIYALMLTEGLSYTEAWEEAESALTNAINERYKVQQAAAAKLPAGPSVPTPSTAPALTAKAKTGEEDPAKVFDEIYAKQERLDDLKRAAAEDEMSSTQKIAAARERLAAAVEREAAIKAVNLTDPRLALDAEAKRVELARELAQLVREESQAQEQLAKKIADKAAAARKEVEAHNQSRNNLMGEIAILEAQASGNDKKEKAARRKLQIENDTLAIMREQQTSEENARRLATREADLQERIARRRDREDGRDESQGAKIGGVTKSARGFGGLAEFDALQKRPTLGIAGPGRESNLDAFKLRQRSGEDATKLLGSGRGQALSQRMAEMTAPTKTAGGKQEDSSANVQVQILAELKRIRTA